MVGWLTVVGMTTLTGAQDQAARVNETPWTCLVCGEAGLTDVLLNLILFLPLGLLARDRGWTLLRTVASLLALTAGIELTQALWLPGRDASLGDVIANTMGGGIGWWLLPGLDRLLHPAARFARGAAWVALCVSTLVWVATGLGLRAAFSPAGPWVGQPLHLWPAHDPFPGSLQRASFVGIDVPNDPFSALPARSDSLDLVVEVTTRANDVPARPISVLRIVDNDQQPQLTLSIQRRDLLLEYRVAASQWLLRTPVWRFSNATEIPTDTPWRWRWIRQPGGIALESGPLGGMTRQRMVPVSVSLGWAFVHPFAPAVGESAWWWTLLWIGCWLGPLGWFAGTVGRPTTLTFGTAAIGSMLLASVLTGIPYRVSDLLSAMLVLTLFASLGASRRKGKWLPPE